MGFDITPQERKRMEAFLKEHPVDPAYDEECEYFDGNVPESQLLARYYQEILEKAPK